MLPGICATLRVRADGIARADVRRAHPSSIGASVATAKPRPKRQRRNFSHLEQTPAARILDLGVNTSRGNEIVECDGDVVVSVIIRHDVVQLCMPGRRGD